MKKTIQTSFLKRQALAVYRSLKDGTAAFQLGFEFNARELSLGGLCGVGLMVFDQLGLISYLRKSQLEVLEFIIDVQLGYQDQPYHSFQHAIDVCVFLYFSLTELKLAKCLSKDDLLVLLISGLCHDLGHPGVNNLYQINANTELAKKYQNGSVLENHSIHLTRELVEKHNLLTSLRSCSIREIEPKLVALILATDMSYHFMLLMDLESLLKEWPSQSSAYLVEDSLRLQLCKLLIHAADISNAVRPWNLCKSWSDSVVCEFFRQGDLERKHGLPQSPNMDRSSTKQTKVALDFDKFIVRPFFETLSQFIPATSLFLNHLSLNREQWEKLNQDGLNFNSAPLDSPPFGLDRRFSFASGTVIIPDFLKKFSFSNSDFPHRNSFGSRSPCSHLGSPRKKIDTPPDKSASPPINTLMHRINSNPRVKVTSLLLD